MGNKVCGIVWYNAPGVAVSEAVAVARVIFTTLKVKRINKEVKSLRAKRKRLNSERSCQHRYYPAKPRLTTTTLTTFHTDRGVMPVSRDKAARGGMSSRTSQNGCCPF